jgi:hypothetical protein
MKSTWISAAVDMRGIGGKVQISLFILEIRIKIKILSKGPRLTV